MFYYQVSDQKVFNMSSSISSTNSSFAEVVSRVVTTIKSVRTVKVEKFSPVKAGNVRSMISSTPAFKRKRAVIESFSPVSVPDPVQVQKVKDETINQQNLRFTVRRRKNNAIKKHRRFAASKNCPSQTSSTQTEEEENNLISKYIEEVNQMRDYQHDTSFLLQLEKEKCSTLRSALLTVLERSEISIDDVASKNLHLKESIVGTRNPDLSNAAAVKVYHDQITYAAKVKSSIHDGLLSSLKSIKKECNVTFADLKRQAKYASRKKHPWSAKTNSCRTISQSSSDSSKSLSKASQNGILTRNIISSKRIPFNPDAKFLQVPKSVQFRVPLNDFLAQSQSESPHLSIKVSQEKIEVEIPQNFSPEKVTIKREAVSVEYDVPKDINLSPLDISQNSSAAAELQEDWSNFASTSHSVSGRIIDDDVGSLLNYESSSDVPVDQFNSVTQNIKVEADSSESMSDN